jgi:parallel beta-helix repeat protein
MGNGTRSMGGFKAGVAMVALGAGLLMASPAGAATIEVPKDFNKIQLAVDNADPGDTVAVSKKINIENVEVPVENLTIKGVAKGVVIDGYDETNGNDYNVRALADGVKLQNLELRNGSGFYCFNHNRCGADKVSWTGEGDDDCFYTNGNNATIKNSKMRGCGGYGISISGNGAKLTDNRIERTDSGCIDLGGDDAVIIGNLVSSCEDGDGIRISGEDARVDKNVAKRVDGNFVEVIGDGARVRDNRGESAYSDCYYVDGEGAEVSGNSGEFCDGYGVYSYDDNARVQDNRFSDLGSYGIYTNGNQPKVNGNVLKRITDYGLYIYCGTCTNATVNNNKVDGTVEDDYGLYVSGGSGLEIIGNKIIDATDNGFYLSGTDDSQVKDNLVKGAGSEGEAAFYISGDGNTLTGNSAITNGGDGFEFTDDENVVKNNVARDNDGDGFYISGTDNALTSNVATKNKADGFENDGTDTVLKKNKASGNRRDCANDGSIATKKQNDCADGSDFEKPGTASRRK